MIARAARALRSWVRRSVDRRPLSHRIRLDDPVVASDAIAAYAALRREGEVVYLAQHDAWLVLTDAPARRVLSRTDDFSSAPWRSFDSVLLGADPPRHGVVRRIVARRFDGAALQRLEAVAGVACNQLIVPRFDAVSGFARPVTRAVAAALIGLDPAAVCRIVELDSDENTPDGLVRLMVVLDEVAETSDAYASLLEQAPDVLTPADARSLVRLLWVASTATTARAIAHGVLRLATDPDLQARLRADRTAIAGFVDEIIRLWPPEMIMRRTARHDVAVAGANIPAGAEVFVCLPAVNRDPTIHAAPDESQWSRDTASLGFGHGPHTCVGGPLARRVVAAAIERLLSASRSFALDIAANQIPFYYTMMVIAPRSVPIRLDRATAG